jgi:hypothetical protein
MMVFEEDSGIKNRIRIARGNPKRFIALAVFATFILSGLWVIFGHAPPVSEPDLTENTDTPQSSSLLPTDLPTTNPTNTPGQLIQGKVAAASGQPLANVNLTIADSNGVIIYSLITDTSGTYRASLSTGIYLFRVDNQGQQLTKAISIDTSNPSTANVQF